MTRELDGSVIALVGATGGLGREVQRSLERRGAIVVGLSPSTSPPVDVRDSRAGDVLVEHVRTQHGRLDGLVIASGIVAFGDLAETDDVVAEELMLTNALGPLWLAKRALPSLAETQGFVAAITGVVAETPQTGMAAYSASKAALSAGLGAIRREYRRRQVAVLDARPPHTETGLAARPLAGTSPRFPAGLDPAHVAERIVAAIESGADDLAAADFA